MIRFATLADLRNALRDAAEAHHEAQATLPPHEWVDWYASFIAARASGLALDWSYTAANATVRPAIDEQTLEASVSDPHSGSMF